MPKFTDNQKLAIIGGVTVALCGLGGAGVWWAKGLVQEKTDVIAQMKNEIADAEAKIRKIPAVEQDVIILRENLYEYVKILPEEKELNSFARVTDRFLAQSGVHMSNYQPVGGTGKSSGFERYTYKFELNATLWQFMQFMNYFEEYERFVQVKDFTLTSGAGRTGLTSGSGHISHQIAMTVETYVYTGSAKGKDVAVPNYPRKVEKLREEIFEARQTIANSGYKFEGQRGRRDIFLDPRETTLNRGEASVGPSPSEQRKIIDRLRLQISECQRISDRLKDKSITIFERYSLQRQLRDQLAKTEADVNETNSKGYISHTPLKLVWAQEVLEPLNGLKSSGAVETDRGDQFLARSELETLLQGMKEDLKAGGIASAIERRDTVGHRIEVEKGDKRYSLRLAIEILYERAVVAREFSNLPLDISGICVNDGGKSGMILNGVVYQEGEYVDNNLLVKGVARDRIEFVYKGFSIVKTL